MNIIHLKSLIFKVVFFSFFLLILFSCTTTRKAIKKPIKEEGAYYLFKQLKNNEFEFNWLSAKFSLDYENKNEENFIKGQIRMKRDSVIWISFSPILGIEVARIILTNNYFKFLNRVNKTYFIGDSLLINKYVNNILDFDMIQSFILGNDFKYYEDGNFKATLDKKEYCLSTANRLKLKKYVEQNESRNAIPIENIWLNPYNFKITRVLLKEISKRKNRKIEAKYSNLKLIGKKLFPFHQEFIVMTAKDKINIKINYSKITINKPQKFPFRIPKKYIQIQ